MGDTDRGGPVGYWDPLPTARRLLAEEPGLDNFGGVPLLAGYFVAVPEPLVGEGLPRTQRLTTASDCLIDRLPEDGCWFDTAEQARAACAPLQVPGGARLYALLVPAGHVAGLVADVRAAATYEPVLLGRLDGGAGGGDAEVAAPAVVAEGGDGIGWEVLGYDHGLLHSWLCNDLYRDAVRELGVETGERGLLPGPDAAERVAAWANARDDTKPVTWVPALLMEWDVPIESRFVPVVGGPERPDQPPSQPWYHWLVRGGRRASDRSG
ncbi:hypothetical protein [Kitasatospora sp. NPDC094011]|uniref:hypothetical protein n=1 Tax=Kitasatospora sp. NPDC094011 TaxID=3364090 RepID=UPI0037FA963B